jgi:ATP-dependent exoDNAse (exonuclease V) alpha subunit
VICKGHARTNGGQLAAYLADYLTAEKNERVSIMQVRGSAFPDLHRTLSGWEAEAKRGKTQKALWHAQMSPCPGEFMTREQQIEAVNILEKHLKLDGQPRVVVTHLKDNREHIHVVWSRIDRETGKARSDKASHRRNCDAAREIEQRFGLYSIKTPKFKNDDKSKSRQDRREESKAATDRRDYQKAERSGLDPRERKRICTECWQQSDTGHAFRAALQDNDYILAHGNSRTFVIVDSAGDIHSLARQVYGAKLADIRERLKDVDPASIPKCLHIQQQLKAAARERNNAKPRQPKSPKTKDDALPPAPRAAELSQAKNDKNEPRDPLEPGNILNDLTQQQSTFTKTDLEREVLKRMDASKNPFTQDDATELIRKVRALPQFVSLGKDRVDRPRFTSEDMLRTELNMRNVSDELFKQKLHAIPPAISQAAPRFKQLRPEQKAAYEHVISDRGLAMVVGFAGSGKSFMLGAAREAWEAQGYRVRGCALSSMAAKSLRDGSDIESRTLASTLFRLKNAEVQNQQVRGMTAIIDAMSPVGEIQKRHRAKLQAQRDRLAVMANSARLTSRDIVVLDEAAMVGSRQMNELLSAVKKAGAKAVLVGDAEQLQAIDAGGAFRALRDRHGAIEITEIRRQKEEWQKQASKDFAQSFTEDALGAYHQRGHIQQHDTHAEARKQMVDDWTESRRNSPTTTHLMMAFTRHDVHSLNLEARAAYRTEEKITGQDREVTTAQGKRAFAPGDRIYFLKNELKLGVMNGSLGTLTGIKPTFAARGFDMTVKLDDGKTVTFKSGDYDHIAHGYAATVHKAQGVTVDRAMVLASRFMDRHAAYVGMSRHRERADLYFGVDEFRNFNGLVRTLSRDRRKDTTLDYLDRAEKAGEPERFWNRLKKTAIAIAMSRKDRARPAESILSKVAAKRRVPDDDQNSPAKLRDILADYEPVERERFFGRSF